MAVYRGLAPLKQRYPVECLIATVHLRMGLKAMFTLVSWHDVVPNGDQQTPLTYHGDEGFHQSEIKGD